MKKVALFCLSFLLIFSYTQAQILIDQEFTDSSTPTSWAKTGLWEFTNAEATFGSGDPDCSGAYYAVFNDDIGVDNGILTTKTFNCDANRTQITLQYYTYWPGGTEGTFGYVDVWDGSTWINKTTFAKADNIGSIANPVLQTVDITTEAQGVNGVKIRFRFEQTGADYIGWFIDDVIVSSDPDAGVTALNTPAVLDCSAAAYTNSEAISVKVNNHGISDISNFDVTCKIYKNTVLFYNNTITYAGTIAKKSSVDITFPDADLSDEAVYDFEIYTNLTGDEYPSNNTFYPSLHQVVSTFPYSMNFDDTRGGFNPTGGNTNKYFTHGELPGGYFGGPDGKDKSWYLDATASSSGHFYLTSPVYDFSEVTNPTMSFLMKEDYGKAFSDNGALLQYKIGTTGTWTELLDLGDESSTTWANHDINLCNYSGESCMQFRFYVYQNSSLNKYFAIDDFAISGGEADDLEIVALSSPHSGNCSTAWTNSETVTLIVKNNKCRPLTNVPIKIELNKGGIIETINETFDITVRNNYQFITLPTPLTLMNGGGDYEIICTLTDNTGGTGLDYYNDNDNTNDIKTVHRIEKIKIAGGISNDDNEEFTGNDAGWYSYTSDANKARPFVHGTLDAGYLGGADSKGDSWYLLDNIVGCWDCSYDSYLQSPQYDLTEKTNPELSFYIKSNYPDPELKIRVNNGAWQSISSDLVEDTDAPNAWTLKTFNLCDYSGQACVQFRFEVRSGHNNIKKMAIDDFKISGGEYDDLEVQIEELPSAGTCANWGNENVKVFIENKTCRTIENVGLVISKTGGTPSTETLSTEYIPSIPRFSAAFYTTTATIDMTATSDYTITATIENQNTTASGLQYFEEAAGTVADNSINSDRVQNIDLTAGIIYHADYDSGNQGWVAQNNDGGGGNWQRWKREELPYLDGDGLNASKVKSWYVYVSPDENSSSGELYIESPSFDFSKGIVSPKLYMDIKHKLKYTDNRVRIEYSDNGGGWTKLGSGPAADWYNETNYWKSSFSDPVDEWKTVSWSLCDFVGKTCVRFRIHAWSRKSNDDNYRFAFDDFKIVDGIDLGVTTLVSPVEDVYCLYSANEKVTVTLVNNSCSDYNGTVDVKCDITDATTTTLNGSFVGVIPAGGSVNYELPGDFNMLAVGNYNFDISIDKPAEYNQGDNTYNKDIEVKTIEVAVATPVSTERLDSDFNTGMENWYSETTTGTSEFLQGNLPADYIGGEVTDQCWYLDNKHEKDVIYLYSPKYNIVNIENPAIAFDFMETLNHHAWGTGEKYYSYLQVYDENYVPQSGETKEHKWRSLECLSTEKASTDMNTDTKEWTEKYYSLCDYANRDCLRFRIYVYKPGSTGKFAFDNFTILENPENIRATAIIDPDPDASFCLYSANQTVQLEIENKSCGTIASGTVLPITYEVTGIVNTGLVAENYTLPADLLEDTKTIVPFTTTFDMTPIGTYNIDCKANLPTDNFIKDNVEISVIDVNNPKIIVPSDYEQPFDTDGDWTATANWSHGVPTILGGPGTEGNSWSIPNTTGTSLLYSPIFDLSGASNPGISFSIKAKTTNNSDRKISIQYKAGASGTWSNIDEKIGGFQVNWTTWHNLFYKYCNTTNNDCVQFRFVAVEADVIIDNFEVMEADISLDITDIIDPVSPTECLYSNNQAVTVEITNKSCQNLTSGTIIPLTYQVTGIVNTGLIAEDFELVADLNSGATTTYTFANRFDMTAIGSYNIVTDVNYIGEAFDKDDTHSVSAEVLTTKISAIPDLQDFSDNTDVWYTKETNGDGTKMFRRGILPADYLGGAEGRGVSWYIDATTNHASKSSYRLYSPVYDLTGLTNPTLSFEYKKNYYSDGENSVRLYKSVNGAAWVSVTDFLAVPHTSEWTSLTYNLCSEKDDCVQFIFYIYHKSSTTNGRLAVDNFAVNDNPIDAMVTNLRGCINGDFGTTGLDIEVTNNDIPFCNPNIPATITSIDLYYSIDGTVTGPINKTGLNITAGNSEIINIAGVVVQDIGAEVIAWCKLPNGATDYISHNDSFTADPDSSDPLIGWPSCNDHCDYAIELLNTVTSTSQTANASANADEDPAYACGASLERTIWYYFTTDCNGGDVTVTFQNIGGASCVHGIQVSINKIIGSPCQADETTNYEEVVCVDRGEVGDLTNIVESFIADPDTKYYITIDGFAGQSCGFDIKLEGAVAFDPADALTGTYTIGSSGANNYDNFQSAFTALEDYGINGNVTFEAVDKEYTEQLDLELICRKDPTNTITFKSYCDDCVRAKVKFDANSECVAGASKALEFDGSNDYVELANESNFDFDSDDKITIEMWIKTNATDDRLLSKMNHSTPYRGYEMNLTAGKLHFYFISSWSGNALEETGTTVINDGVWHHIAITYDGSSDATGLKFYIDGVLETTTVIKNTLTGTILNDYQVVLGRRRNRTIGYYNGEMDEVRIWNTERTEAEIQANICNTLTGNEAGLIAYYDMEDDGCELTDRTTNANNGTLTNMACVSDWVQDELPESFENINVLDFDGSNDYVAANSVCTTLNNPEDLTYEAWIKTTQTGSFYAISAFETSAGVSKILICLKNNFLNVWVGTDRIGTAVINDDLWHHIAMVKDDTDFKIYVDGVLDKSFTATVNIPNDGRFSIGQRWTNSTTTDQFFKGRIDEVRIWNTARTATEIDDNKDATLTGAEANLVAYYNMESVYGSTLLDRTTNGNDGTLTNMEPVWVNENLQTVNETYAMNFDGTNDNVKIANESSLDFERTDAFSIELLVKTTDTQGILVSKMQSSSPHRGYELGIDGGKIQAILRNSTSSNRLFERTVSAINDDSWHHIAVSYDGSSNASGLKIYIDGVEETTTIIDQNLSATISTTLPITIGLRPGFSSYIFKGEIDEVRIWNDVRTATEIDDNKSVNLVGNEAGLVAYYDMEEGKGNSITDQSNNSHKGTLNNMNCDWITEKEIATTKESTVLDFDGTNDKVTLDALPALTDFSVEFWATLRNYGEYENYLSNQDNKFCMYLNNDKEIKFMFNDAYYTSSYVMPLNTWTHVALSYNSTSNDFIMYINGIQEFTFNRNYDYPSDDWILANNPGWSSKYGNLKLDEFRFWSTTRTETEINDNMFTTVNTHTDLIASYDFEDGSGTTLTNRNNPGTHNGTLTNMQTTLAWLTTDLPTNNGIDPALLSSGNYVMKLAGTSFINFDRIDFEALNDATAQVIQTVDVHDITFNDCIFTGAETTTDNTGAMSLITMTNTVQNNNVIFTDNQFLNGSFAFDYTGSHYNQGVEIKNNVFTNQAAGALKLVKSDSPQVNDNLITTNSTRDDYTAISFTDITTSLEIRRNEITSSTADGTGILLNSIIAVSGTEGIISNNMIAIGNDADSYGINFDGTTTSEYLNIYFNSVNVNSPSSTTGQALRIENLDNSNIKNNIFESKTGEAAKIVTSLNATSGVRDYNNYMPGFAPIETHNILSFSDFTSPTDLHLTTGTFKDAGVAISGITTDFDGETRDDPPFIGADEFLGLMSWTGNTNSDWNNTGNWNLGVNSTVLQVPGKGTSVSITDVTPKDQPLTNNSTSGLAEARNLSISNNAVMEVESGKYLTVYENFNNAGTFIVKSNATGTGSFIPKGTYTNTGTTSMELYLSGGKFHYISSPITNKSVWDGAFYLWDETIKDRWLENDFVDWSDGTTPNTTWGWATPSGTMTPGRGYVDLPSSNKTATFTGEFNNGPVTFSLDYTNHGATAVQDVFNGWNIVGNPYPSTLNWNSPGVVLNDAVDNAIYVYADDGTHNYDLYKYYMKGEKDSPYPDIAVNASEAYCQLAPGQSAMVRANAAGGQIVINNEAREHTNVNFFKSGNEIHPDLLRLQVDLAGVTDETIIRFIPGTTSEYDGRYDAFKRYSKKSKVPQIYCPTGISNLAINTLPELTDGTVVPIVLKAGEAGKYTISATELNFEIGVTPYLIDKKLKKRVNLIETPKYTFKADAEYYDNRFVIVFKVDKGLEEEELLKEEILGFDDLLEENVKIYSNKDNIYINFENMPENDNILIIQDVLGRKLVEINLISDKTKISMNRYSSGNYFVKIINNNEVYEQKVFVE